RVPCPPRPLHKTQSRPESVQNRWAGAAYPEARASGRPWPLMPHSRRATEQGRVRVVCSLLALGIWLANRSQGWLTRAYGAREITDESPLRTKPAVKTRRVAARLVLDASPKRST